MSCLCGSKKCDCEEECFCPEALCGCAMCKLLPKMCPHCSLPYYDSSKEYACQVCSCGKQDDTSYSEAMSGSQTTESETSYESQVPVCQSCELPIFLVDIGDEDEQKHKGSSYCRCPQKNEPMLSEHETSTSTSDHRQVSADRQVRKALSRKTRTEKSNWQAKKAKDRTSNSPEQAGNNIEIVSAGTLPTDSSSSHFEGQGSSYSACATYASNTDNINPDFNSPQKRSSRTEETTADNVSLLVNISGVSSQLTPEASSSQTSGYKQANVTREVPPFPLLPNPIPVPPGFSNPIPVPPGFEGQQYPQPIAVNLEEAPHPLPEQDPVERTEKMEKWFGTIKDVLNTSGELPDAETAAALDKPDKGKTKKKSEVDDSAEFHNVGSIPSPKGKRKVKSDTDQHTDTDRSTSVSQFPIESDRIESESD